MDKLSDDALTRFYADSAGALEAFGGAKPDVTNRFKMLGPRSSRLRGPPRPRQTSGT
jgi:hypothetical protein